MTNTTNKPRVRFAPSPTGMLHVGSARAALFNWLYARHTGGTFLVRIEDTDLERSTEEATRQILDSLEWLGLTPDEPVEYQARRAHIHRAYLQRLLDTGHAYRCYCPKERLDELREQARAAGRIFAYRREMFPEEEARKLEAAGAPYVIRFRAPVGGVTAFDDLIYGHIEVENDNIGDFVIARADGSPLYNFTNVVDDLDMGITLICRGEDHVPNTPKQIMIYRALGVEPPQFAHLPLILGPDKKKLSKRHGATGVTEFREMGILREALVNYLALLGWAPPEAEFEEVMPLEELIARFQLERVSKSPAVFDHEKLLWMNGVYIRKTPRAQLDTWVTERLEKRYPALAAADFSPPNQELSREAWLRGIIGLVVERTRTLNDFVDQLGYFFEPPAQYEEKAFRKFLGSPEAVAHLAHCAELLASTWEEATKAHNPVTGTPQALEAWCEAMEKPLREWSEAKQLKFGNVAQPIRLAVTGRTASPPLFHVLWYLGREESVRRIEKCVDRAKQALSSGTS
ncbi:MAG: glutamate--tRNA ligase [Candidatus Sumerlaea chitinivorans]|uniref:Glutamate--tRNA ligase n=1 Tax=Sumerlaea chitinivorans TaxID=2250252 RepID=A0A2Z4Y611_SUMC1|nr:Glutamyl-tRNA synthetase [Candidatus Sumerlaea chitinivorans]MCX7963714.1 glutamate--tRNA ligase [Candidatus Sumerlaea chitinivorans]